jgi:hypothetical protein
MQTSNLTKLIQSLTGRPFIVGTKDENIQLEKEYFIYHVLPISQRKVGFIWLTPKTPEKLLKSFITAFCNKYKEPNPRAYDYSARTYGPSALYENKTPEEKEFCFYHHSSNMYSKQCLMEQIKFNFDLPEFEKVLLRYGFYPTEYGIGIFILFVNNSVSTAVKKMSEFLKAQNIPFSNELSDAQWVLRFKLNISKEKHTQILQSFN